MVVEEEDAGSGEEEEDGAQLWVKSVTTRYSVVTGVPATTHSSPVQSQHQNNKPEQVGRDKSYNLETNVLKQLKAFRFYS